MTRFLARPLVVAVLVVGSPVAGVVGTGCTAAAAQEGTSRAGLIIHPPDGPVREFCVSFTEESITGYELLRRSGAALSIQDFGGDNVTVCSIDGIGCTHPTQPCFCRCVDVTDCEIWGYYTIGATGAWEFSQLGASVREVRDGDVDGWRFGRQSEDGDGLAPAPSDRETICARGVAVASSTGIPGAGAGVPWAVVAALAGLGGVLGLGLRFAGRHRGTAT